MENGSKVVDNLGVGARSGGPRPGAITDARRDHGAIRSAGTTPGTACPRRLVMAADWGESNRRRCWAASPGGHLRPAGQAPERDRIRDPERTAPGVRSRCRLCRPAGAEARASTALSTSVVTAVAALCRGRSRRRVRGVGRSGTCASLGRGCGCAERLRCPGHRPVNCGHRPEAPAGRRVTPRTRALIGSEPSPWSLARGQWPRVGAGGWW